MYPDCVLAAWQIAKRQGVVNPENTFASVKRFIGRKMNEVKEESKQVPYKVGAFNLYYEKAAICRSMRCDVKVV